MLTHFLDCPRDPPYLLEFYVSVIVPNNCAEGLLLVLLGLQNSRKKNDMSREQSLKIRFRYALTPQAILTWDTILSNNNLYIEVPNGLLPDASKEAFVALLEYAEEILQCNHAIVYFLKDRVDRAILIRTFMFLGFYVVPPGNELAMQYDNDHVFMVYKIT